MRLKYRITAAPRIMRIYSCSCCARKKTAAKQLLCRFRKLGNMLTTLLAYPYTFIYLWLCQEVSCDRDSHSKIRFENWKWRKGDFEGGIHATDKRKIHRFKYCIQHKSFVNRERFTVDLILLYFNCTFSLCLNRLPYCATATAVAAPI